MIKKFSEFVTEAKGDVTIVFGRFNPPTSGHEKLFETLKKIWCTQCSFSIFCLELSLPMKQLHVPG